MSERYAQPLDVLKHDHKRSFRDFSPKWARRSEEVHDSKYYRVTKSPTPASVATTPISNNNFNINGISTSVSQRLLLESEVELSDREGSESETRSWRSKSCCCGTRCWSGKPCSCTCGCLSFKLSKKLDTILLWVVGSLTCTANVVMFAMLTTD
ncbi:hypothetical protein CHS0354_033851 [Potamilus streckersoni]|uniref:Uncharacterized protein n=1 Tax=Potamilus streckersoni TaxID=2493646 RepID=A0AAE0RXD5_9BIVA|nr:hypothetical protein CHS0354_033851 [Potamilus streckersoni]